MIEMSLDESCFILSSDGDLEWAQIGSNPVVVEHRSDRDDAFLAVQAASTADRARIDIVSYSEPRASAPPAERANVEFSVRSTGSMFLAPLVEVGPTHPLPTIEGEWYRIRVIRAEVPESEEIADAGDLLVDEEVELFRIEVWPEAPSKSSTVGRTRSTDPMPAFQHVRALTRRIGDAVDRREPRKVLSGVLGDVSVAQTVPMRATSIFDLMATFGGWDGYVVHPSMPMGVGATVFSTSDAYDRGGDGLTGTSGHLKQTTVVWEPPSMLVREWEWYVPRAGEGVAPWGQGQPFLAVPTVVAIRLETSPASGPTRVEVAHRQLPEEWCEAMRGFWARHLAVMAYRAASKG